MEYMSLFIEMSPQHKCKLHVCIFCNEIFCHFSKTRKDLLSRESSEVTSSYYYFFAKRFHHAKCPIKCYATIKYFIEK